MRKKPITVHERLRRRERDLSTISRISAAVSSPSRAGDVDELVRQALQAAVETLDASTGSIFIHDPARKKLVFTYVIGEKADDLLHQEIPDDVGIAGAVFQAKHGRITADTTAADHYRAIDQPAQYVARNLVTVPLSTMEGQCIGVLQVLNKRDGAFDDGDLEALTILARHAASAIETARLYRERKLAEVAHRIGDLSIDMKNILTPVQTGTQTLELMLSTLFSDLDECLAEEEASPRLDQRLRSALAEVKEFYREAMQMTYHGVLAAQDRAREIADAVKGVIAERQFAEADVRDVIDEEDLSRFFSLSLDLLCIAGFDGRFKRLNPAWEKMLGLTTEEMLARPFLDFVHPDDRAATVAEAEKLSIEGTTLVAFENRYLCKDGSCRWLSWTAAPFASRQVIYAVGHDITERKRVEEALRTSEERLQAVLDNSTAVIYLKDTQGRYLLISRSYETLFHVRRDQVTGKTDYDIFPTEMADAFRANDQKVLEAGTPLELEEVAPHDDGLHTYISIKFPLYDADGLPYGVCGISTDITARKQAEVALRTFAERLRLAQEAAHIGTWDSDLLTGELDWSDAVASLFGFAPAPTRGHARRSSTASTRTTGSVWGRPWPAPSRRGATTRSSTASSGPTAASTGSRSAARSLPMRAAGQRTCSGS